MKNDLYIVSRKRVTYMEDKKIIWVSEFKDETERVDTINHLKEFGARIKMA